MNDTHDYVLQWPSDGEYLTSTNRPSDWHQSQRKATRFTRAKACEIIRLNWGQARDRPRLVRLITSPYRIRSRGGYVGDVRQGFGNEMEFSVGLPVARAVVLTRAIAKAIASRLATFGMGDAVLEKVTK